MRNCSKIYEEFDYRMRYVFQKTMNEKTSVENQQFNISQKNYRESAENPTENLLGIFLRTCQVSRQMHLYFVFVYCLYLLKFASNKYLTGFFLSKPSYFFLIEAQFKCFFFIWCKCKYSIAHLGHKLNWASIRRLLFDTDFNTYQQAIFFGTSTKAW